MTPNLEERFAEAAQRALLRLQKAGDKFEGTFERVKGSHLVRDKAPRREGYAFFVTAVRWSDEAERRNPDLKGCHAIPRVEDDPRAQPGALEDRVRCQALTRPTSNHSEYRCRWPAEPGARYCTKHRKWHEAWDSISTESERGEREGEAWEKVENGE